MLAWGDWLQVENADKYTPIAPVAPGRAAKKPRRSKNAVGCNEGADKLVMYCLATLAQQLQAQAQAR
ncbi:MAG: hypothetical protein RSE46_26710, partial [Janthinobacterium sp.]